MAPQRAKETAMDSMDRSGTLQWTIVLGMMGLGICAGALVPAAHASPPPGGGRPHEPPPFAFEACAGKSEGADCTVTFHDRTIEGSCVAYSDQRLFCMPDDMPPPPDGERPPRGD
jgi:hypothetical protein